MARTVRAARTDLRDGVLARRAWPGIALISRRWRWPAHLATFLIAARTAGVEGLAPSLLPLAMLALVAMGVPTNIAGWGPREGVTAWTFGVAGLGAALGVTTAVVFGVLVLVASLPGAGLSSVADWLRRESVSAPRPEGPRMADRPIPC